MYLLADLLADPEKDVRSAAAQALGASGKLSAVPLLRFKAKDGDAEAEVVGECLKSLMKLEPKESLGFVVSFLKSADEEVRQGTVFALAESKQPGVFRILKDFLPKVRDEETEEVVFLAMAMLRVPEAIDFLVGQVSRGNLESAKRVLGALAIHKHNDDVKASVAEAVAMANDAGLTDRFRRKFEAKVDEREIVRGAS